MGSSGTCRSAAATPRTGMQIRGVEDRRHGWAARGKASWARTSAPGNRWHPSTNTRTSPTAPSLHVDYQLSLSPMRVGSSLVIAVVLSERCSHVAAFIGVPQLSLSEGQLGRSGGGGAATLLRSTAVAQQQGEQKKQEQDDGGTQGGGGEKATLGFSFTPGGLLFPYSLGVAKALQEKELLTERTPIAGASAGALACSVVGCDLDMMEVLKATEGLLDDCREFGTALRLRDVLKESLNLMMPHDAHEIIARREGPVQIGITRVFPWPTGKLIEDFKSKEDLIEVLCGSCAVPFWLTRWPWVIVRSWPAIDGFFGVKREHFGAPDLDSAHRTVRITPFPGKALRIEGAGSASLIGPTLDDQDPLRKENLSRLMNAALNPGSSEEMYRLFDDGYQEGLRWYGEHGEDVLRDAQQAADQAAAAAAAATGVAVGDTAAAAAAGASVAAR